MNTQKFQFEEILTIIISVLTLVVAGTSVFIPGFYDGVADPQYALGTITADAISLVCIPLLIVCIILSRQDKPVARIIWVALLVYVGYTYAVYAFDRLYTIFFPLYMLIFSLSVFATAAVISRMDILRLGEISENMRLRRVTAIFIIFTGLILYVIELPIILSRIPDGVEFGGTPFMVLDMTLVAPIAIVTGIWVWQRRPWGAVLAGIFLVKAITIMTSFLIADYINWLAGTATNQGVIITFSIIYILIYIFSWNYFSTFRNQKKIRTITGPRMTRIYN
jgi:hypothetical protein